MSIDPRSNGILKNLPNAEYDLISGHLKLRTFEIGAEIIGPNTQRKSALFPVQGICSVVISMEDGGSVEVSTVGKEGMAGLSSVFGVSHSTSHTAQSPVAGYEMGGTELRGIMSGAPGLASHLAAYSQLQYAEAAQSAACNRLHEAHERLARWLLVFSDKLRSDEFELTHEFIAQMLGTRRPTVSLTARVLQQAGLIDYRRGKIFITDREALRGSACECYGLIARSYAQLATMAA